MLLATGHFKDNTTTHFLSSFIAVSVYSKHQSSYSTLLNCMLYRQETFADDTT